MGNQPWPMMVLLYWERNTAWRLQEKHSDGTVFPAE
jgi:hypothetical protein